MSKGYSGVGVNSSVRIEREGMITRGVIQSQNEHTETAESS